MIDTVQKLESPPKKVRAAPFGPLAREALTLCVGGVEQVVEIIRQPRHLGGTQAYWLCRCGALRSHLFVVEVDGGHHQLLCRVCGKLDYRSRHVPRAVARAAKLRRALNAPPGLLNGLPVRPRNVWAAARYDRLARELAAVEDVIAGMLGATVRAVKRRKDVRYGRR